MGDLNSDKDLTAVFDAFGNKFAKELRAAGGPPNERIIQSWLGRVLQDTYSLSAGSVVLEYNRTDVWLAPRQAAIEIKFSYVAPYRSSPGLKTLGTVLDDICKLANTANAGERYFFLVSDRLVGYLQRHYPRFLPLTVGGTSELTSQRLAALTPGVRAAAAKRGWRDVAVESIWTKSIAGWRIDVWRVTLK